MMEKFVAIFFAFAILGQAWIVKSWVGTWLFPACLFGVFWFLMTFFPLILALTVPINVLSMVYILICCIAFSISALITTKWKRAFKHSREKFIHASYGSDFIRLSFYLVTILTIVFIVMNTGAQGISIEDVVFDIAGVASSYIERRYNESLVLTVYGQLSLIFTYVAAMIGGLVYAGRPRESSGFYLVLLFIIPSAVVMMIQGNKGTLFLSLAYFLSGVIAFKIKKGEYELFESSGIRVVFGYALMIVPVVFFSFYVRGLQDQDDMSHILAELQRGLLSYSSSHLYAFSDWFSHYIYGESIQDYYDDFNAFGFHTFMSIFKMGGDERYVPNGYYDEYYKYQDVIQSNIYTIFRGLIYDFGLIGSIVYFLIFGLISHIVFYAFLAAKYPVLTLSFFAHFVGYLYTSFLISQFVWNSIYATFFIFSLILWLNKYFSGLLSRRHG